MNRKKHTRIKKIYPVLLLFCVITIMACAQQAAINKFVSHVEDGVSHANNLMSNDHVEEAVAALNDVNR
ncbi:MAG: hypothetical protein ACOYXC_03550, partial [Candidatus Rifleibacteriota bacterium]